MLQAPVIRAPVIRALAVAGRVATCTRQADDRLLLIRESAGRGASGLLLQHVLVPHDYLAANYPVMHAALSADGAPHVLAVHATHMHACIWLRVADCCMHT